MKTLLSKRLWSGFLILCLISIGQIHAQGNDLYKEGMSLKAKGSNPEALEMLIKAGNTGHTEAQFQVGMMYAQGLGVPQKSYSQAVEWWEKAAEKGHKIAQYNIGVSWENASHDVQDYTRAAHYYQLSANQEYPSACYALGVLYLNGKGVKKDTEAARLLFEKVLAGSGPEKVKINAKTLLANIPAQQEKRQTPTTTAEKPVAKPTPHAETAKVEKKAKAKPVPLKIEEEPDMAEQLSPEVIEGDKPTDKILDFKDYPTSVQILVYFLLALNSSILIFLFILACRRERKAFFAFVLFIFLASMFFMPTAVALFCTYWMFFVKSIKNSVIKTLNIIIHVVVYFLWIYIIAQDQNLISSIVIGISALAGGIYFLTVIDEHISMNRCPYCNYYHEPMLIDKECRGTSISNRGVSRDEYLGQHTETGTGTLSDGSQIDVKVNVNEYGRRKGVETTTTKHYMHTLCCMKCDRMFQAETVRSKVTTKWN